MKAVVFLALLGVAAARPQFLYPGGAAPVITYKAADTDGTKVFPTPLTYGYPAGYPTGYPTTYGNFPYAFPNAHHAYTNTPYTFPFGYPVVNPVVTNPEVKASRTKRSAEAEPEAEAEADPYTIYSSGHTFPFAGTTAYNYPSFPSISPYSTYPTAAISPYSNFPAAAISPYSSFPNAHHAYTNTPYTFPFGYPVVNPVVTNPEVKASRTKRSAEAEADAYNIYSTGHTSFPFVGTTAYNYPSFPAITPYSTYPTAAISPYSTYPAAAVSPYSSFPAAPLTYTYPTYGYPNTKVVSSP